MADKAFKWVAMGAIALVALSIAYYLVWFLPEKESASRGRYVAGCIKEAEQRHAEGVLKLAESTIPVSDGAVEILNNFLEEERTKCKQL